MDFKTKKLSETEVELTVTNEAEEVQAAFEEAYRQARAKLKLPGFRKGKAPLELVQKHLGDSVADDAARELIAAVFEDIAEDLDPKPITVPRFSAEEFSQDSGARFKGVYEAMPKIKLGKYKKLKVTEDFVKVSEEDIQSELEKLQKEKAPIVSREGAAQMQDFATIDIDVSDQGKSLYRNAELRIQLGGNNTLPGIDEEIVGMQADETKEFQITLEEGFPDPNFAGKTLDVRVRLLSCQYPDYPEIDDEFAADVGDYETLADLKKKIREEQEGKAKDALKQRSMQNLVEQVSEASKFPIPASLIDSELQSRLQQIGQRVGKQGLSIPEMAAMTGQKPEDLEKELRESAEKGVRDRLILQEITKEEKIEVTREDIVEEIKSRYGAFLPDDQMGRLFDNDRLREDVEGRLLYWKALERIYANADVKKGKERSLKELREEGVLQTEQ